MLCPGDFGVSDTRTFTFRELFTTYKLSMQCKSTMSNTVSCFFVTLLQPVVVIWLIVLPFLELKHAHRYSTNTAVVIFTFLADFILTTYLLSSLTNTRATMATRNEFSKLELVDECKRKEFEEIIAGKISRNTTNELAVSTENLHDFSIVS